MGIDINWRMIQGATLDEWKKVIPESKYETDFYGLADYLTEGLELDYISPYFDADTEDQIYGVKLTGADYPTYIDLEKCVSEADKVLLELDKKYNILTKTYIGQHVW